MKNPIRILVASSVFLLLTQYSTQGQVRVGWGGLEQRAATDDFLDLLESLAKTRNSTVGDVYDLQTLRVKVNYPNSPWISVSVRPLTGKRSTATTISALDDLVWEHLTQNVLDIDAADEAKNADKTRKPNVLQVTLADDSPKPSLARVNDSILKEMLGEGMHLYFRSDFEGAVEIFTKVIDYQSKDPLVFYFRGLAFDKLGRTYESEADYEVGAGLEAARKVPARLNESLYRVQGSQRMKIEEMRLKARVAAVASKRS
ncbi:MAG TPA: hypothetical protein DDZ51_22800 [Planctomycetaceae bacterium]|nr:hypothetical protein [Planctomycetaceae bacterium]